MDFKHVQLKELVGFARWVVYDDEDISDELTQVINKEDFSGVIPAQNVNNEVQAWKLIKDVCL